MAWQDFVFLLFFVFLYVFGIYTGHASWGPWRGCWLRSLKRRFFSEVGELHWKFSLKMAENTKKKSKGGDSPSSSTSKTCVVRYPKPFTKQDRALEFDKKRFGKGQILEPPEPPARMSMRPSELATADPRVTLRYHEPIQTTRQPSRAIAVPKEWRNRSYSVNK